MTMKPGSGYPNEYRMIKEGTYAWPDIVEQYDGSGDPRQAAARQVGGTHYKLHNIQPWDIIDEYGLDFYRGNAIKYILRNKMDVVEDIEKAVHYLEKWLEDNKESK